MRNASSYDLIRARRAGSSGYLAAESRFSRPSSSNSPACSSRKTSRAGLANGSGFSGIDRKLDAVVLGTQVARTVAAQPATTVGNRRTQHHELRQVVVQRAQTVANPRADRRKLSFEHVPAGVELQLGPVVVVGRPHRTDHGQVVDARARRAATSR